LIYSDAADDGITRADASEAAGGGAGFSAAGHACCDMPVFRRSCTPGVGRDEGREEGGGHNARESRNDHENRLMPLAYEERCLPGLNGAVRPVAARGVPVDWPSDLSPGEGTGPATVQFCQLESDWKRTPAYDVFRWPRPVCDMGDEWSIRGNHQMDGACSAARSV